MSKKNAAAAVSSASSTSTKKAPMKKNASKKAAPASTPAPAPAPVSSILALLPAHNPEPAPAPAPAVENVSATSGRYLLKHAGQELYSDDPSFIGTMIANSGKPWGADSAVIDTAPPAIIPQTESVPAPVQVISTPAPAPAPEPSEAVNAQAAQRIQGQHDAVKVAGFAAPELWYPIGTPLYSSGTSAASKLLREIESLPYSSIALPELEAKVKGENRRDIIIPDVTAIRMDSTGAFILPGLSNPVRPTKRGLQTVQADLGIAVVDAIQAAQAKFKNPAPAIGGIAVAWNAFADNVQAERGEDKAPSRVARVRNVNGEDNLFALVSDRYAREIHAGDIAANIIDTLQSIGIDPKAAIQYAGDKVQIDLVFPTPINPGEFHVGEAWKIQIRVSSDDTGGGSLRVTTGIFFARCRNFSVSTSEVSEMNRRHLGDSAVIARELRRAIETAHERVQPLIASWNAATQDDLVAALPVHHEARAMTLEEAFPGFARSLLATPELVAVLPRKNGETARKLLKAWTLDDGPGGPSSGKVTRAGLVNAFTRFAHEEAEPWAQDAIERTASGYLDSRKHVSWLAGK